MAYQGHDMSRRITRLPQKADCGSTNSTLPASAQARRLGVAEFRVADEGARTRLIGDICCLLREPAIPESARSAGLELIGWLARRMPGEPAHALGVPEALRAERATRRKAR
jgi:hypothetical protein